MEKDSDPLKDDEVSSEDEVSDDSSQGLPEYDVADQGHVKWSELPSPPPPASNDGSNISIEMTEKNKYVADGTLNSGGSKSPIDKQKGNGAKTKMRCFQFCEVLVLTPVMLVIVGLFTIPTVFHALPSEIFRFPNKTDSACLEVQPYSGEVCRDTLVTFQTCFSGVSSPLNIPSVIDQQTGETTAMMFMNGIAFLNPSLQCREVILPFLCLFVFKLCDLDSHLHNSLRGDCLEIRDDICAEEWFSAVNFLGDRVLPICEDLPDITDECVVPETPTNDTMLMAPTPSVLNSSLPISETEGACFVNSSNNTIVCADNFYHDENGTNLCRPICGEFDPSPYPAVVVLMVSICICFVASTIMFILALVFQRKTLLVFPSILYVYMCITTFVESGVIIAGFVDYDGLYCGSRDLLSATAKGAETTYCTLSGVTFNYALVQICTWAMLHATFLFWGVVFPFSYRQLRISGRIRHAHIISIILAVVIPLPAGLIHLVDGYVLTANPAFACAGRNVDITFYTFVLPISLIIGITACLLVLILWTIFKEFVLKKLLARTKVGKAAKAQLKITGIIIYYTLVGVMGLVTFTYYEASNTYRESAAAYILCESGGLSNCDSDLGIDVVYLLSVFVVMFISFLPVMTILFSCDPNAYKKKTQNNKRREFTRTTSAASRI